VGWVQSSEWVWVEITNSTTVSMMKVVNGTQTKTSIANGQVLTAGSRVRVRVVGSTFQFRTWLDGQPEPSTWKGTVTDTAVIAPGQLYPSLGSPVQGRDGRRNGQDRRPPADLGQ
ncbi:MAG: hypothetical protein IPL93_04610, partial [Actinomycetales bacterium]|nr:hypothetical protein [Actinomycetales bacterium]